MTKSTLELRRLIYGMINTIIVTATDPKEAIEEIETIRSSMTIEGFIFRPGFANTTELTEYTPEDWAAMYAQYAITYGWSGRYQTLTGMAPKDVLDVYFADLNNVFSEVVTGTKQYNVGGAEVYSEVMDSLVNSKIVLRAHQIEILNLLPIAVLERAYKNGKFVIKETEILVMKRLAEAGSAEMRFTDPSQIVKFVIAVYPKTTEPFTGQVTNNILKGIEIKIPTSMRKKIVRDIEKMNYKKATVAMKHNLSFWKRLFKQLAWTSEDKMVASGHFPNYLDIKGIVYNETIKTNNTLIEELKRNGYLQAAFLAEMHNPGQMLRSLFFYLRYPVGSQYAKKLSKVAETGIAAYFDKVSNTATVLTDIRGVLESKVFVETLMKSNSKILWQLLSMIDDKKWHSPMQGRKTHGKQVNYTVRPLPALDPTMTAVARKAIKKAIKKIKLEENKSLGKVYIDDTVKNYKLQFSGRSETSISLSGEYLSPGSKLSFSELIKGDNILRLGIAWRGTRSCDIDHSVTILDGEAIGYFNPTYTVNGKTIITSSGDITSCGNDKLSVEFIDIDITAALKHGINDLFTSMHMYSGPSFKDVEECYWFMNVIPRADRIIQTRKVHIALDEMQYALQIKEDTHAMLGFGINLSKGEIEVLSIPSKQQTYRNARTCRADFEKALLDRPVLKSVSKALKKSIDEDQLTDNILEADLIISTHTEMPEGIKVLHPGRDMVEIQNIIF